MLLEVGLLVIMLACVFVGGLYLGHGMGVRAEQRRIRSAAAKQMLAFGTTCGVCGGRGHLGADGDPSRVCSRCEGSGRLRFAPERT